MTQWMRGGTLLLIGVLGAAGGAFAQDKPAGKTDKLDPMIEAMIKAGTPGPEHQRLAALAGSWVPHDRATLGVLFYRGIELLRDGGGEGGDARTLLRIAAQGYRATRMLDVVPVALGCWAEAERRCGDARRARELAAEAVALFDEGSPSLLNEAPVFLALHDACVDLGVLEDARGAIAHGVPRLLTRVKGLAGTPYARTFLTQLAPNAGLIAAAEAYGLLPADLAAAMAADSPPASTSTVFAY